MRRVLLLVAVVGVLVIAAPPWVAAIDGAGSQAVPGAIYSGTHSGGGTVSLNVARDGTAVTEFAETNVPGMYVTLATGPCTIPQSSIVVGTQGATITGNAFDIELPGYYSVTGTFDAPQHAQGTFKVSYGGPQGNCSSPTLNWQATTTASPGVPAASTAPTASPAPTASTTPTPTGGIPVTYPAGWNLVGAPAGTLFAGASDPLYALTAAGSDYVTVPVSSPAQAGQGYWAYFAAPTTVMLPRTSLSSSLSVALPAGRYVMAGNPSTQPVTVSDADQVLVFDRGVESAGSSTGQYRPSTVVQPGQGAFVVSLTGGSAVISSGATTSERHSQRDANP